MSQNIVNITVPNMGDSVTEAVISKIYSENNIFKTDEPVFELETDKINIEVPAPKNGKLVNVKVAKGDTVNVGQILAEFEVIEDISLIKVDTSDTKSTNIDTKHSNTNSNQTTRTSPAALNILNNNQDLQKSDIQATGKNGNIITKIDVINAIDHKKQSQSPSNDSSSAASNNTITPINTINETQEIIPMTNIRKTIAKRLKNAQNTAAILTTFNEVDMTNAMELRKKYQEIFQKKYGIKLGFMSIFTRASALALQEMPIVNAEIDQNNIIYKNYYHIGVAIGSEKGLVVPVIRNSNQLGLHEIEIEISQFAQKANKGGLNAKDMSGGTFTISNGGVYGSLMSTPIINPPQSAILGMHSIVERPIAINGQIVIRPMMYLALSYDHRIIDGKEAVTFLKRIKEYVENPERMLLFV